MVHGNIKFNSFEEEEISSGTTFVIFKISLLDPVFIPLHSRPSLKAALKASKYHIIYFNLRFTFFNPIKLLLFCEEIHGLFVLSSLTGIWTVFVFPSQTAFSTCGCCKEDGGKERCNSLALPELGASLSLFTTEICETSPVCLHFREPMAQLVE